MFKVGEEYDVEKVNKKSWEAEQNYTVKINDLLGLEVYTQKGERIIDPDFELTRDINPNVMNSKKEIVQYLVQPTGVVDFPVIGLVKCDGLTIYELKSMLEKEYASYYEKPYVVVRFLNKRVVVLGSVGGVVVPIENENMKLTEVIALAGGIDNYGKAGNIRLIRGEDVFVIDLSTIEGLKSINMTIQPDDVVYIEPVRRPFMESIRDYSSVISLITSLVALLVIFQK